MAGRLLGVLLVLCSAHFALAFTFPDGKIVVQDDPVSGKSTLIWKKTSDFVTLLPTTAPTVAGATLTLVGFDQTITVSLPASNWQALRDGQVYVFLNPDAPAGPSPVKKVVIKSNIIKVKVRDSLIDLDDQQQGRIGVGLTVASDEQCSRCGSPFPDAPGKFRSPCIPNECEHALCGQFVTAWGGSGSASGQFDSPLDVAADASGANVYVADTLNHRVQRFDGAGNVVGSWGTFGTGTGEFDQPTGVATNAAGRVYVVDSGNDRIQRFEADGTFVSTWGTTGAGPGEFDNPLRIAIDSLGDVYVADLGNVRIQKFDESGVFLLEWGSYGPADGQFEGIRDVAVAPAGDVYVIGPGPLGFPNRGVQRFDSSGTFVSHWSDLVYGAMTVDGNDEVYVGEFSFVNKVADTNVYVTDLDWLAGWPISTSSGSDPVALETDQAGNVYVLDRTTSRVLKYACP